MQRVQSVGRSNHRQLLELKLASGLRKGKAKGSQHREPVQDLPSVKGPYEGKIEGSEK